MNDQTVSCRVAEWKSGTPGQLISGTVKDQGGQSKPSGVILMGGDCGALGVARSLGRNGVAVRFLPGPNRIAGFSRYTRSVPGWPGAEDAKALPWLEAYAEQQDAKGWVLVPAGDSEVRLVTNNHERLARLYRLTTPPWHVTRFAADKTLTYGRAEELGIGHPRTYRVRDAESAQRIAADFPLILKPAMKEGINALTIAKAWRADDRAQFLAMFDEALRLAGAGGLIVQELIPDDGTNQFSYCAFCVDGEPRVVMNARRTRQKPRKAGTGTFVETLGPCDFEADAASFLKSLDYTGLVEIEFMFDPRDRRFKLIDVNPRVWTWNALGLPAGVNFAMAAWNHANGVTIPPSRAEAGHSWLYAPRDMASAAAGIREGSLPLATYLRQLTGASAYATFAWDDPVPALLDTPLGILRGLRR
jgi:D-aspartate ligase